MKGIATCEKDVCEKPMDFYSIGHVLFGYITYCICLTIWIFIGFFVKLFFFCCKMCGKFIGNINLYILAII